MANQLYDYVNEEGAKELIKSLFSSFESIETVEYISECDFLTLKNGLYIIESINTNVVYDYEGNYAVWQATIDFKNGPDYYTTNMSGYNLVDTKRTSLDEGSIILVKDPYVYVYGPYTSSIGSEKNWSTFESIGCGVIKGYRSDNTIYWTKDTASVNYANSNGYLPKSPSFDLDVKFLNARKQWVEIPTFDSSELEADVLGIRTDLDNTYDLAKSTDTIAKQALSNTEDIYSKVDVATVSDTLEYLNS